MGTRLIAVHKGKKVEDWVTRRREPKVGMSDYGSVSTTGKVLVGGIDNPDEGLRYSLAPWETLENNRLTVMK